MIFDPQAKLLWHGDRIKEWVDSGRTSPILIEIAPTGFCNASCSWCFFDNQKSNEKIDKQVMLDTLEQLASVGLKAVNWSGGGEPTLHPNFGQFVKHANKLGLKQGLFTNGYKTIPHQEMFEWIRISLTPEGFKKIKKPRVPFGICVNQCNEARSHLIKKCKDAKKFGASYFQVRPALTVSYENQPALVTPEYLKELRTKNFEVYVTDYKYKESIKPKKYKYCYGYHFCPSIDWKGNVSVCLYLTYNKNYILGNLNNDDFSYIWSKIPVKKKVIAKCQNCCKNHEINKVLYNTKNIKSVEFL